MLIRFEASNYLSIAETVELSLVAVDRQREEAREAPLLGESLLTVSGVFGPNASGKSNVVAAFAWVRDAVQQSLRLWDEGIPLSPFAFGAGPHEPSAFVVEALIGGVRFEYVLEIDVEQVLYEGLFHYPEKKRRRIFEREGSKLTLQRGLGNLSGTRELLTDRTLALSAARRFDEPLVSEFARQLLRTQVVGQALRRSRALRSGIFLSSTRMTMGIFEDTSDQPTLLTDSDFRDPSQSDDRERALALLRLADLGIEDIMIDEQEIKFSGSEEVRTRKRVRLLHRTAADHVPLEFEAESEGTRTWFNLIGPVLSALRTGSLVLIDELDANLHPTLSSALIRLFHDRATNPRGAQLVFTARDASLLNHLNRDEVWLTEKRDDGSTRLGALAEFAGERVRKSQNLESGYLHGRFGALPQVDQTELLRSLGLIGLSGMGQRRRSPRPLKRVTGNRQERRTIVVFCEGRNSEPDYVNGLKKLPHIADDTALNLELHPAQGVPLTLVRLAVEKKKDPEVDEC